jgi:CheY-like chemotaxis protein
MVRILIIDDDLFILRMADRMLAGFNCMITSACSGPKGIERYRQSPHDLVITDVAIPVLRGLETIRALRALKPSLPILAISGGSWLFAGSDLLDLARQAGATETLAKPFTAKQLRDAISCCMLAAQG